MRRLWTFGTALCIAATSFTFAEPSALAASKKAAIAWRTNVLRPSSRTALSSLLSTNSAGKRTWKAKGACTIKKANVITRSTGTCRLTLTVATKGSLRATTSRRLFTITTATPAVDALGISPITWYPTEVPAKGSPQWNVAISSYVRGQDVYPLSDTLPSAESAGCAQATQVERGVIVLAFGRQTATGTSGFGMAIPFSDMKLVATAWAAGLARCARGPWELALGTSNSGGVTPTSGFFAGVAWAQMINEVRTVADPRVIISAANDLEPGWGPPGQARAWVDGYVRTTSARMWNFGSADACPQYDINDLTCGNGWTVDDVLWVSSHAGPNVVALPQIHTLSGSQARQWALLMARARQIGIELRIMGPKVQSAACAQRVNGCGPTGLTAWNAWQQLRSAIDAISSIRGTPLAAPADIRWGWGGPFYSPPATTTTTTTVAPTTTSSSTTTTTVATSTT